LWQDGIAKPVTDIPCRRITTGTVVGSREYEAIQQYLPCVLLKALQAPAFQNPTADGIPYFFLLSLAGLFAAFFFGFLISFF
jgi:hypothetical protein